ncbi:MAG: transglycosylase SLT domain-containing protein [Phaeodactylibacter sp.]|uniref:lytic transglycosylase domain-containing protein n=1 Tax=Phaeodactylibacter sp. TaxID=1940289 RepID=UPI0032EAB496
MKAPTLFGTALLAGCLFGIPVSKAEVSDWQQVVTHDIPYRLQCVQDDWPFEVHYNEQVQEELSSYLRTGRREAEAMLGRTPQYFPIIEHYLKVNHLPEELKYIPLLESRLRPAVESAAGAVGLWQFMPATAKGLGLHINGQVDERRSPYQSTETAMRYLTQLYRQFDDWALVLAAYNCGPGRVRRALRETGCSSFWDIEHRLPRQTRRYLPRLIATIYVGKYFDQHGLQPKKHKYHADHFRVFRIHHSVELDEIARYCEVSLSWLQALNPGYLEVYAPRQETPHYLILPQQALPYFARYIDKESRKVGTDYAIAVLDSQWKSVALEGS